MTNFAARIVSVTQEMLTNEATVTSATSVRNEHARPARMATDVNTSVCRWLAISHNYLLLQKPPFNDILQAEPTLPVRPEQSHPQRCEHHLQVVAVLDDVVLTNDIPESFGVAIGEVVRAMPLAITLC